MKNILCYGDSNTFGFNTIDGSRFDKNTRWTSLLQKNLNNEYKVINEGMCNRTGFIDNPNGVLFSSQKHFPTVIENLDNIEILILWIGTNDLQFKYNIDKSVIENKFKKLINLAKDKTKNIIIIPPVKITEKVLDGTFNVLFNETSVSKSKEFESLYKQIAEENNCFYFDVNKITKPCDIDGIHYDKNAHKIIADNLYDFIKNNI